MKKTKSKKGFTLLEILLVVAALGILAGIVIVAINPGKQMADTRNAQRAVDVNTIINAIYQYAIDTGHLPQNILDLTADTAKEICTTGGTCGTTYVNLSTDLAPTYISSIPVDPQGGTDASGAGYTVLKKSGTTARVTIEAPGAEISKEIKVTR
jgi:prepilin-type N-terminal cleavage/methylation domain-containing protein